MASPTYISRDSHWRVSVISLDGTPLLRVETDHPVMPVGQATSTRTGPVQGPGGWWLQEDCIGSDQVEKYVPLSELLQEEVT